MNDTSIFENTTHLQIKTMIKYHKNDKTNILSRYVENAIKKNYCVRVKTFYK